MWPALFLVLATGSSSGVGLRRLELLPVTFDEIFLLAMTKAGVEVVFIHFGERLLEVPLMVMETINGPNHACPMASAGAVNEELARFGVGDDFQKFIDLVDAGIALIHHRYVDVAQSGGLDGRLFVLPGIVREIDNGFDSHGRESFEVFFFWPGAAIEAIIYLAEILNFNVRESIIPFGKSDSGNRKDENRQRKKTG